MSTSTNTTDAMAAIEAMAARLRDEYGAEAVILYGSRADGGARADSDVDLLIIKAGLSEDGIERFQEMNSILSEVKEGYSLDTRLYTPEQIERTLARGDHFVQDIILHGRVLHKREGFAKYIRLAEKSYDMNPQDSEYPEDWTEVAEEDFEMFRILLEAGHPSGAGYHLQQAVEKFFKAYLIRQGWRLQRTHDLAELLNDALQYDATLGEYRAVCELVTEYDTAGRYPISRNRPAPADMSDENVRAALDKITPLIERLRAGSARADTDEQNDQDIQGGL